MNVYPRVLYGSYMKKNKFNKPKIIRIATWNVYRLKQAGKLRVLENELTKGKIDILGMSETYP